MIILIFVSNYPFPADWHRTFPFYFIDKYVLHENEIQLVCLKTNVVSNSSVTVYLITNKITVLTLAKATIILTNFPLPN